MPLTEMCRIWIVNITSVSEWLMNWEKLLSAEAQYQKPLNKINIVFQEPCATPQNTSSVRLFLTNTDQPHNARPQERSDPRVRTLAYSMDINFKSFVFLAALPLMGFNLKDRKCTAPFFSWQPT